MATDELSRAGLRLTPIPESIRSELKEFVDLANSMLRNPLDLARGLCRTRWNSLRTWAVGHPPSSCVKSRRPVACRAAKRLNALLKQWPGLDLVVYHHGFDISPCQWSDQERPVVLALYSWPPMPVNCPKRWCSTPWAMTIHSRLRSTCAALRQTLPAAVPLHAGGSHSSSQAGRLRAGVSREAGRSRCAIDRSRNRPWAFRERQ